MWQTKCFIYQIEYWKHEFLRIMILRKKNSIIFEITTTDEGTASKSGKNEIKQKWILKKIEMGNEKNANNVHISRLWVASGHPIGCPDRLWVASL